MAVPILGEPHRPGLQVVKQGVFVYRCPTCKKREMFDDMYGPCCTGPGATDQHPMTPMKLVGKT